jgi:hypothetical protein
VKPEKQIKRRAVNSALHNQTKNQAFTGHQHILEQSQKRGDIKKNVTGVTTILRL